MMTTQTQVNRPGDKSSKVRKDDFKRVKDWEYGAFTTQMVAWGQHREHTDQPSDLYISPRKRV